MTTRISHAPFLWILALAACSIAGATTAGATTILVPSGQPTIQAGIDAAAPGDTVLVAPGVYSGPGNRNLTWSGRDLVLLSEQGAAATVIDVALGHADEPGRGFDLLQVGAASTISGFTVRGGDARNLSLNGRGGGALLVVSAPTFRDCIFRENRAQSGANGGGGAVALISSSARFENTSFLDNVVEGLSSVGGAVVCVAPSTPVFLQCRFEGNSVNTPGGPLSSSGGAFFAWDYAAPLLEQCTFFANSSDTEAAGFFSGFYSQPTLRQCVFEANSGRLGGGGLIAGTALVEDCDFIANTATFGGGGLEIESGVILVTRCRFLGNTAVVEGGGVRVTESTPELRECVFAGNTAPEGGGLYVRRATVGLARSTFYGNSSGIMVGRASDPIPSQLIMAYSIINGSTSGRAVSCGMAGTATLTCSDVFGNAGGDWVDCIAGQEGMSGNFSLDPCFCAPANGDYTLSADSPCAPAHSPAGCDLIGALPVGCAISCGTTALEATTWGQIKALHR